MRPDWVCVFSQDVTKRTSPQRSLPDNVKAESQPRLLFSWPSPQISFSRAPSSHPQRARFQWPKSGRSTLQGRRSACLPRVYAHCRHETHSPPPHFLLRFVATDLSRCRMSSQPATIACASGIAAGRRSTCENSQRRCGLHAQKNGCPTAQAVGQPFSPVSDCPRVCAPPGCVGRLARSPKPPPGENPRAPARRCGQLCDVSRHIVVRVRLRDREHALQWRGGPAKTRSPARGGAPLARGSKSLAWLVRRPRQEASTRT